jgi:hypothetical protein
MKNHELLDLIGDVNEDYVQAADGKVIRPKFRWKAVAACAACAVLVLGAYPAYQAAHPPLHSYTVLEGGGMTTQGDVKAPAGGTFGPGIIPGGAYVGDNKGETGIDGTEYTAPGQDAPLQEKAAAQYDALMKNGGISDTASNPDWYGGAWIDNSFYPEAKLAVAIVDGFRTDELEAQIEEWCGGEVVFKDAKYALAYLYALQDLVTDALTGGNDALSCGIGVDVTENCLGVDIYSDGKDIPKEVLVKLAQFDPDGDAIRVRLFTGKVDTLTDETVKGPAPAPAAPDEQPVPAVIEDGDQIYHGEDAPADAIPGGASPVGELPQTKGEDIQPARHDLLPPGE